MAQPITTTTQPGQEQAGNATALLLDRVKAIHLEHRVSLLAIMSVVRNLRPGDGAFDDLAAVANALAETDAALSGLEADLLKLMSAASVVH